LLLNLIHYIDGIFFILCGFWGLLISFKKWPVNQKKEDDWEKWHKNYGKLVKYLSPIIILYGVLSVFGVLN